MAERIGEGEQNKNLAAIGTATVKIAHEIGNSLHIVSASLDLIQVLFNQQRGAIDDCILSVLSGMTSEVERMKELLDELRDVSRPPNLNIERVNLHEVVTGILHDGRLASRPKTIALEHHIPNHLPPVFADKEKLARILLNLCVNAFEAMPNGGKLALRAYKADERVCLELQDTGVGMPENFDPFRPFNTTKKKGWGLGLSVVSEIVQALHGTVSYDSRPGEGTTFRLCLPAGA